MEFGIEKCAMLMIKKINNQGNSIDQSGKHQNIWRKINENKWE